MHAAMNAALVPKQVIPLSAARSHNVPSDGYPGLPSNRMIDASLSSTPTMKFHIIQPVVVNQNIRSPAWASRCNHAFFRCSSRIPPCPWTIGFGSPVVPEEYKTHSGWSNGSCANSSSESPGPRNPSSHPDPSR